MAKRVSIPVLDCSARGMFLTPDYPLTSIHVFYGGDDFLLLVDRPASDKEWRAFLDWIESESDSFAIPANNAQYEYVVIGTAKNVRTALDNYWTLGGAE